MFTFELALQPSSSYTETNHGNVVSCDPST